MAKAIEFRWDDEDYSSEINKVDRAKLYGYKEAEVVDEDGDTCEIATLAADGQTLIGKGGTGIGYITVDGNWCDRNTLQPVGVDGSPLIPVKSSFQEPIELSDSSCWLESDQEIAAQFEKWVEDEEAEGIVARSDIAGT
jgi:hypothetical protein